MSDEYLDLVDAQDRVIGRKPRAEVQADNLTNIRVVNVFIVNGKGELWIPRRTAQKRTFPLCLDMSMGGHVENGESYEDALKREMREELDIDVAAAGLRLLGHLSPHADGVSSFMKVYEIRQDEAPTYNPDDFIEFYWLSPAALFERIAQGEQTKEDLPRLVKRFYGGAKIEA